MTSTYDPTLFQMTAIKVALRAWAKHKVRLNRAYTPKAMLATAAKLTGKRYKMGEFLRAADDLEKAAQQRADDLRARQSVARSLGEEFGRDM